MTPFLFLIMIIIAKSMVLLWNPHCHLHLLMFFMLLQKTTAPLIFRLRPVDGILIFSLP